jgi:hypothetical protein
MGPPYEASITYTEDLVRLAARRFLRVYVRRDSLLALAFILWAACLWLFFESLGWQLPVILTCVAAIGLLAVYGTGFRYTRQSLANFKMMKTPVIVWRFCEGTIAAKSDLATIEGRWNMFSGIWCFPEVWLFTFGKNARNGYSMLPVAKLTQDVRDFIIGRVKATGGTVSVYK